MMHRTSGLQLPRAAPRSCAPIAAAITEALGDLVPPPDAARIEEALDDVGLFATPSLGLEVVLPPHTPACDLSVLLGPGQVPTLARRVPALATFSAALAQVQPAATIWWECDTSGSDPAVGAFARIAPDGSGIATVRDACAELSGLPEALARVIEAAADELTSGAALLGFFPTRTPAAVGALVPVTLSDPLAALDRIGAITPFSASPSDPQVQHLARHCTAHAISIGADAHGRIAVSFEGSFRERERAMLDGQWAAVLDAPDIWGTAHEALSRLQRVEGVHVFDAIPPLALICGIDHIKVGPGSGVKAYVGAVPYLPGTGPAGMPDTTT